MRTPPLLLGAALLFWGWQTGFLVAGAAMAVVLESARLIKPRWELSDEDFSRLWTLCSVLFLTAAVYAFTANERPGTLRDLFQAPNSSSLRSVGTPGTRAAAVMIRWLPMVFFLFVAAQTFSSREEISLATISLILRRRAQEAQRRGRPTPAARNVNLSYPYFVVCLFAASIHTRVDHTFFCGLCALLLWAFWPQRSRRFGILIWGAAFASAIVLGYFGQYGFAQLQRYLGGYNPQWLTRYARPGSDPTQSRTALGRIGRLQDSGTIIIRLETKDGSPAPALLREASYRTYRAETWLAGTPKLKDDFANVSAETNGTTWVLLPGKATTAAINLGCYLDDGKALLPLPPGSGRLENLPAFTLQNNSVGAVLAEGPGLVIFDVRFGPGATLDSAPNTNEDLSVPAIECAALDQVIAELQPAGQGPGQALKTISGFFQSRFTYSTWQPANKVRRTNETPLSRFLLRSRQGHCEYFATATVLLLRRLGIQARYAVGYSVHEGTGRKYVVRQRDAHAWCLVWSDGKWQDFDTTPASWIAVEAKRASPLQYLSDGWSRIWFEFSKFRWGQSRVRQYILWGVFPVLMSLLYQTIFRRTRRSQRGKQKISEPELARPGLDSEFYQLEKKLLKYGMPRPVSEPLPAWLQRVTADPGLADAVSPLRELLRLHYRYRFDPLGLSQSEREHLRQRAQAALAALAGRVTPCAPTSPPFRVRG